MEQTFTATLLTMKSKNFTYRRKFWEYNNKILNLRKEVEITIKSKETGSQLGLVKNSYVTIMHQLQPVTVSSNTCSQIHVQIKHSLAHPQYLIFILTGITSI